MRLFIDSLFFFRLFNDIIPAEIRKKAEGMIVLWIVLGLLLAVFVVGLGILSYACGRRAVPDLFDPDVLDKRGYGMVKDDVLAGKDWLTQQETEDLELMSYDGKLLHALLVPCDNARGTIILFHGWRSSWKLDFGSVLPVYHSLGLNLIICDQRAYGKSEGLFTCFGVKERHDVVSWATYASQLFGDEHPILLGGISMGASTVLMASDLDLPGNVRGIIADCGFSSPYDIMDCVIRTRFCGIPVKPTLWLMGLFTSVFAGFGLKEASTFDSVAKSKTPILFIHGTADRFVPPEMSERACELCAAPKKLVLIEGAGHGLSYPVDKERVTAALFDFINTNIGGKEA